MSEFAPGSNTPTTLSGLKDPMRWRSIPVAVSLWSMAALAPVSEFAAGSGTPTTLSGLINPFALAFDSSGNLYVTNYNGSHSGIVSQFAPGSTAPTATFSGLSGPEVWRSTVAATSM